jgi:hypothetical protein
MPTPYNGVMAYDALRAKIAQFDELATSVGFGWPRNAPVEQQMAMMKEFLSDVQVFEEAAMIKWMQRDFLDWYRAMIAVEMLCEASIELSDFPSQLLKKQLELATLSDLSQDFEQSQAKEYLYELQIAGTLHRSGFTVVFAEPDLRVSGNGLSRQLGIACKYVSSEKKLNGRISKGYEQIADQGISGIVAVGMDNIIAENLNRFIQFPDDPARIRAGMAKELGHWIQQTIRSRAGVAERAPLDGAMFTLRMVGIWGAPKRLVAAMHVSFQFDESNPIRNDIERLAVEFLRSHHTALE